MGRGRGGGGDGARTRLSHHLQIDYYCRLDCLWKKKFKKEREEFETMESVNRLLLENVLPAHVAAHFIGDKLNEVWCRAGPPEGGGNSTESFLRVLASPVCPGDRANWQLEGHGLGSRGPG